MSRHNSRSQSKYPPPLPLYREDNQQNSQQYRPQASQNKQYIGQQAHHYNLSKQQQDEQQEMHLQRNCDKNVGRYDQSYRQQEGQSFRNHRQQPYPDFRQPRNYFNDERYNEQPALKSYNIYKESSNISNEHNMFNLSQYPQTQPTKSDIHSLSQRQLNTHLYPNDPSHFDEIYHTKSNEFQTGNDISQNTEMSGFSTEPKVSSFHAGPPVNNKGSMIRPPVGRYQSNTHSGVVRSVLHPPFHVGLNRPRYRQMDVSQNISQGRFPHQQGISASSFQGQHLSNDLYIDQNSSSYSSNQFETSCAVDTPVTNNTLSEQPRLPLFEKDSMSCENDIYNQDKIWLQQWLKQKGIDRKEKTDCKIMVPVAKSLLKTALTVQQNMKSVLKEIKDLETGSLKTQEYFKQSEELKFKLEEVKKVLGSSKIQQVLQLKMIKARKKRDRQKRKRRQIYEEKISKEEQRKQMHEEIDKWQESVTDKIETEKREKELKTIADKALAEVRHKSTDVSKGLEVLQNLRKLRMVRKDSKERKGLFTSKDDDHMFEARLRILIEFLQEQLKSYEAEKNMIQVMLDTEQEECQDYEKEELQRTKEEKESELKNKIKEYLFGKAATEGPPSPHHPMYSFHMYYDSANHSVDNLCAIRHEWDQFIVDTDSYEGSCIPPTWVIPSEPSSEAWGCAL